MSESKVLETRLAHNARQLQSVLDNLYNENDISPDDIITFGAKGESLRIRLIEDTLTDGSKVYNINIE